jgi:uncharacterized protein (DUF924 family)
MSPTLVKEVIAFWFAEGAHGRWFAADAQFDDDIRQRFGDHIAEVAGTAPVLAAQARLDADEALAAIIALDQFPRNIHRGSARAFEHDNAARAVANYAIRRALDASIAIDRRLFFYLPFQHSESLDDQQRSVVLFTRWAAQHAPAQRHRADEEMVWVLRHREIIEKFGRFPHRNAALARPSSAAELAFLREPNSSF